MYHYAANNPIKYTDPDGRDDTANQVLDAMFEQGMDIFLSKEICNKIGLDFAHGVNKIQNKEQLEEAKKYTKSLSTGKEGYTINFTDGTRISYDKNGVCQYYESAYDPMFPMYGAGKNYGLRDGDFQQVVDYLEIVQVGKIFVHIVGPALKASKGFKSPKGNIRIEKGIESVPKEVQRELGIKLNGPVEKPWHLYFYGYEIPLNPFNPNWRFFPR